ncbi:DUF4222 domain-containing protein [Lelliottia wanjuensis]|uniref:DUF4222 domain-containing protein n=1 Tax=Lelliottia wanjuensis TaxID=3050585 RepID=UPI00254EB8F6|nr:DUF4222 domain-containing protein [Lelliottia sp. V86_10]MDK9583182.1 DUF4222 domain-containing protein [Lelliottia sp. V86_10]
MSNGMQKIEVNSRWVDGWGKKITVIESDGFRILFLRDGYAHPCRMTDYRFTREFKHLPEESAARQAEAKENGVEKIQQLKNLLQVEGV